MVKKNDKNIAKKCLLTISMLCFAPVALSKDVKESDPKAWFEEIKGSLKSESFPRRLVFLRELPVNDKDPLFLDVDVKAFNELGFFEALDTRSVAWDYKLNPDLKKKKALPVISQLIGPDTFVIASASGPWQFIRLEKGKIVVMAQADAPNDIKPQTISDWLPTALGWDGVVIAAKDDELLVASTKKILAAPEIQALAVRDSASLFKLPKDRKGSGLLSLSHMAGGVGVFDVVILEQGVKSLDVGTKLIIEKKVKKQP